MSEALGQIGLQPFTALWEPTWAVPENMVVDVWENPFLFTLEHFEFFSLWLMKNNLFYKPNSA